MGGSFLTMKSVKCLLAATALATLGAAALAGNASADGLSDDVVTIGVLSDMSGVYKEVEGPGAVIAAQMAIDDFGGTVLDKPIKVISADHQNKPDVASSTARQWIDQDHVDMITGLDNSAVGLAVQGLASDKKTITINGGSGTTELQNDKCTPYGIHYVYDTYSLPVGTATAIVKNGGKSWFFVTADYTFGHSLQENTAAVVKKLGGTVAGNVDAPLSSNDFSSYLLQAQSSGADVIGLANAGGDTVNALKQANEFGIVAGGQQIAGMLVTIADVKAMGLDIAHGLQFTTAFYWDRNDESREWSKRFFEKHHAMPTMMQAGVYSAVKNYLESVKAAGTDDPDAVRKQLGKITINDVFVKNGKIGEDGLMRHDMYLVKVKEASESKGDWDLMKVMATIPADTAFQSVEEGSCPLVKK